MNAPLEYIWNVSRGTVAGRRAATSFIQVFKDVCWLTVKVIERRRRREFVLLQ